MFVIFDHMDIHSENQETCRGDDYLSIGKGGERIYVCGQSPDKFSYRAFTIPPKGRDAKVQFVFRTNNDGDAGSGVQLLLFGGDLL